MIGSESSGAIEIGRWHQQRGDLDGARNWRSGHLLDLAEGRVGGATWNGGCIFEVKYQNLEFRVSTGFLART
jgi:hypothetical protein